MFKNHKTQIFFKLNTTNISETTYCNEGTLKVNIVCFIIINNNTMSRFNHMCKCCNTKHAHRVCFSTTNTTHDLVNLEHSGMAKPGVLKQLIP